jgi:hypothetical protein
VQGTSGQAKDRGLENNATVSSVVHAPLRGVLTAWLKAQWEYLSKHVISPPGIGAPASNPGYLLVPRTVPFTLISPAPSTDSHSYLLSWQSASTYTVYVTTPADGKCIETMEIASTEPVPYPVSNVILTVPKWAPHVFYIAPEHSRVHKPSAASLIPNGKGWLDLELQRALRISMPYLAIQSQVQLTPL